MRSLEDLRAEAPGHERDMQITRGGSILTGVVGAVALGLTVYTAIKGYKSEDMNADSIGYFAGMTAGSFWASRLMAGWASDINQRISTLNGVVAQYELEHPVEFAEPPEQEQLTS